jgi:hypothetical protein
MSGILNDGDFTTTTTEERSLSFGSQFKGQWENQQAIVGGRYDANVVAGYDAGDDLTDDDFLVTDDDAAPLQTHVSSEDPVGDGGA